MITLLLLGLVGVGAVGATYALGPLQKALPPEAITVTPWVMAAAGLAAAVFAPAWLAFAGIGVAIAGAHQAAFATRWVIPERPAPAAIPAGRAAEPHPKPAELPRPADVPRPAATLPRPPAPVSPELPGKVPEYLKPGRMNGDRAGSLLDFAKEAAAEYLTSGAGVPDRFSAAWRTALAQWPSSHPIPTVVTSQMDSNPDGPLLNVDLRLPPKVKWDGPLVERWVSQSDRAVRRGGRLSVYPLHPQGEGVYRFTVATA